MANGINLLSISDVLSLKGDQLPLLVFSRSYSSHFATAIANDQKGFYNHFMLMVEPKQVATQDWLFHSVDIGNYLEGQHELKFMFNPNWTQPNKIRLLMEVRRELKRHWFFRRYDLVQIIGFAVHLRWLQIPWLKICSDRADFIRTIDKRYDLVHPSPPEVNNWCKNNGYLTYGRFIPVE